MTSGVTLAPRPESERTAPVRVGVCVEATLGHRTFGLQLAVAAAGSPHQVDIHRIGTAGDRRRPVPWALQGSLAAYRAIRRHGYDVAFFHTQSLALLARRAMPDGRYVVGVDATPHQFDSMAKEYRHARHPRPVEAAKHAWYGSVFRGAAAIVALSRWAARSLVDDYGVAPGRIRVIHPGAATELFSIRRPATPKRPVILFVGDDFQRKGGPQLLEAFRPLAGRADLALVTSAALPAALDGHLIRGVRPGTPEHARVFQEATVFCLPTLADCTPLSVGEAMASGLPVVSTTVGSNEEWVTPDAGLLVPPGDVTALREALTRLVDDPMLAHSMGVAARHAARTCMDAGQNAAAILELLAEVGAGRVGAREAD